MSGPVAQAVAADEVRLSMVASSAAAGLAWSLIKDRLIKWSVSENARLDAHQILFELVANAVGVTPMGGTIVVACVRDQTGVVISVSDCCPLVPVNPAPVVELQPEDLDLSPENWDVNGGWGLTLVQAMAAECGVDPLPSGSPGKTVWARLRSS